MTVAFFRAYLVTILNTLVIVSIISEGADFMLLDVGNIYVESFLPSNSRKDQSLNLVKQEI